MPSTLSGSPRSSARPGSPHERRSSGTRTRMPSVNSVMNSARVTISLTTGAPASMRTRWATPSPERNPTSRNSTAVEMMLRSARSEISTAAKSVSEKSGTGSIPRSARRGGERTARRRLDPLEVVPLAHRCFGGTAHELHLAGDGATLLARRRRGRHLLQHAQLAQ